MEFKCTCAKVLEVREVSVIRLGWIYVGHCCYGIMYQRKLRLVTAQAEMNKSERFRVVRHG